MSTERTKNKQKKKKFTEIGRLDVIHKKGYPRQTKFSEKYFDGSLRQKETKKRFFAINQGFAAGEDNL